MTGSEQRRELFSPEVDLCHPCKTHRQSGKDRDKYKDMIYMACRITQFVLNGIYDIYYKKDNIGKQKIRPYKLYFLKEQMAYDSKHYDKNRNKN